MNTGEPTDRGQYVVDLMNKMEPRKAPRNMGARQSIKRQTEREPAPPLEMVLPHSEISWEPEELMLGLGPTQVGPARRAPHVEEYRQDTRGLNERGPVTPVETEQPLG